ncbi:MAG TPA: hypothetical protein VGN38_05965 [Caulobacteraceae bacterium]|jgi:hypothetical protein|nr:hypothetical protein [Caulobacteraceae bacterium]
MARKPVSEDRRELIRQAERQKALAHDERSRAMAAHDERLAVAEAALAALTGDLPPGDNCPMCWYGHGVKSPMRNTPENPAQPLRDRFACRVCGYAELRRA